jgi:hypothetical protein
MGPDKSKRIVSSMQVRSMQMMALVEGATTYVCRESATGRLVGIGLGHIIALYYRSSASYHIC